ncbi:hypothetical protein MtrunA17_Chr4g0033211 [Medicago truncatula]|uniref:Transmembrane protein n=1 Tax=Medicago truncatula TaxID=3880 RepID=A0A396I6A2_MEDTR|nr:hypothetical protein MtrunA17_Chr4g0033211 [Medicago truncatula]
MDIYLYNCCFSHAINGLIWFNAIICLLDNSLKFLLYLFIMGKVGLILSLSVSYPLCGSSLSLDPP